MCLIRDAVASGGCFSIGPPSVCSKQSIQGCRILAARHVGKGFSNGWSSVVGDLNESSRGAWPPQPQHASRNRAPTGCRCVRSYAGQRETKSHSPNKQLPPPPPHLARVITLDTAPDQCRPSAARHVHGKERGLRREKKGLLGWELAQAPFPFPCGFEFGCGFAPGMDGLDASALDVGV